MVTVAMVLAYAGIIILSVLKIEFNKRVRHPHCRQASTAALDVRAWEDMGLFCAHPA